MAAFLDVDAGCVVEPRRTVVERFGALGEVAEHVEFGQRPGAALEAGEILGEPRHERLVERLLSHEGAFARSEHAVLELLELGGDVAFGPLQGLAPDVVGRRSLALGLGELDEVAVHPVVADLQSGDPGALALARFERFEEGVRIGGQTPQLVELGVVALGEHPAVAHQHRRRFDDGAVEQRRDLWKFSALAGELVDAGAVGVGHRLAQPRDGMQGAAKLRQIARSGGGEADARQDALQIPDVGEQRVDGFGGAKLDQHADRVQALRQRLPVADGAGQPAAQQPAAHRGCRPVHDPGQRRRIVSRECMGDLQVAARHRIEDQRVVVPLEAHRGHVRERTALRIAGVDDQRAGRAGREGAVFQLEGGEVAGRELLDQDPPGRFRLEMPGREAPQGRVLAERGQRRRVLAEQDFGRAEPFDLGRGALGVLGLRAGESAARQLQPRDAPSSRRAVDRREQVVAPVFEQVFVGQRPRGDDAGDLPLDRAARRGRIADLLADRGRFPFAHEFCEVRLDRMRRHPRHRDRSAARAPAGGERDVEQLRGAAGVVEEQLVEIPHPVEEQGVGMLRLDAQVLRDDRGAPGRGRRGRGHRR